MAGPPLLSPHQVTLMASRPALCLILAATLWLVACDNAPSGMPEPPLAGAADEDVQQELQGSWLREYEQNGVRAKRMLVLGPDGHFEETVRVTDAAGQVTEHRHAGTWLYDGTNLKRKYTSMDGKPPSRLNLPFVALALKFESRNEFVGTDHVHRNEVRYRRVQPETTL
ncbi:MAG: hypothetical protein JWQ72_369 [Polaromonas sp.]|nr:hypothetical protein [Polaromonas sp.]